MMEPVPFPVPLSGRLGLQLIDCPIQLIERLEGRADRLGIALGLLPPAESRRMDAGPGADGGDREPSAARSGLDVGDDLLLVHDA